MRHPPNISVEDLRSCLREQYAIAALAVEFLSLGLDYDAGVYRVVSEQGTAYFLKVKLGPLYEPSCLVPRYLNAQGIAAVVAPIPTRDNALWARLTDWSVIVYPFLDGDTSFEGMTNEQWHEVGTIFKQIHEVPLPPKGFASLRQETFDPAEYIRWVRTFEAQHLHTPPVGSEAARAVRDSWVAHQATIDTVVASLETLAATLQSRPLSCVICHADLHPANLLRTAGSRVFVIDWDDVMLAPKEHDFIFVREPQADAFWDGYGQVEIDWVALTYFQWERVIQDVIEYAKPVYFRDDWAEESKANAFQGFDVTFAPNNNVDAAYAAAAHLPRDLTAPDPSGS